MGVQRAANPPELLVQADFFKVTHAGESLLGAVAAVLNLETTAGPLSIPLNAQVSVPPQALFSQDLLDLTVQAGNSLDTALLLSNLATTPCFTSWPNTKRPTRETPITPAASGNSQFLLTELRPSSANFRLRVFLRGDFSAPNERVRLFLNGEDRGFLTDNNRPDNTLDTAEVSIPPRFLNGSALSIGLENSNAVAFEPTFANYHGFELYQVDSVAWLELPATPAPLSGPQNSTSAPLRPTPRPLTQGLFAALRLGLSDPDQNNLVVPLRLTVVGTPLLAFERDTIDFGSLLRGAQASRSLQISNQGTDTLRLNVGSPSDPSFSSSTSSFSLAPGAEADLPLHFQPLVSGAFGAALVLAGADGSSRSLWLRGEALPSPDIQIGSPDTIRMTMLTGRDSSLNDGLPVYNNGDAELRYHFFNSAARLLVWDYALDEAAFLNNVSPLLASLAPSLSSELAQISSPAQLLARLNQADILLVPNLADPDPAVLGAMASPIRMFLERGGRVCFTRRSGG
ncbi:MAG: hypothetical protein HC821_01615 [Lewinella sp.]|nr:hypothetical protein [Lewinella sp.]